jgi:hypothetical protein
MARASADTTMLDDPSADVSMNGGGVGRRGGRQGGFQRLPQLTGLPQVIGLALGSPEFQRR